MKLKIISLIAFSMFLNCLHSSRLNLVEHVKSNFSSMDLENRFFINGSLSTNKIYGIFHRSEKGRIFFFRPALIVPFVIQSVTTKKTDKSSANSRVFKSVLILFMVFSAFIVFYQNWMLRKRNKDYENVSFEKIELEKKLKKIKSNNKELKKTQNYVANDIHDTLGNRLAGINNLSEILKESAEKPEVSTNLFSKFFSSLMNATALLNEDIKELSWAQNTDNNMLNEVINKIKYFISEVKSANSIDITTFVDCDKNYELPPYWNRQILLVTKEIVNNATVHSGADKIELKIIALSNVLQITCTDNGIGFNTNEQNKITGIGIVRSRAASIGCNLDIISEKNNGVVVTLSGSV